MDKKVLWRMVHTGLLVCIVLSGIGRFLGIASLRFPHALTAFGVLLLLTIFQSVRARGKTVLLLLLLFIPAGAGAAAGGRNCLLFLQSWFFWLAGVPSPYPEWVTGYELLQTVFVVLFCCLVQVVMEKEPRLKPAGILAVFAVLLYFLFARKVLSRVSVAFMICYGAVLYVEWTQIHWKKEKGNSIQAYMLWIMPFLAVYFLLMLVPEIPEKPYDWQFVKTIYGQIKESVLKFSSNYLRGDGEDYDLSLGGFSERGKLKDRTQEEVREIMTVESRAASVSNIYLMGKVYDSFGGRQWEARGDDIPGERYLDMIETLYAADRYDREYRTDYLARLELKILYKNFRSEFLFVPLKLLDLEWEQGNLDIREKNGSLCFDRKRGYGTEYAVSFYQLNEGQDAFWMFVEEAAELEEDERILEEILKELSQRAGVRIEPEDMRRYRQAVSDCYREEIVLTPEAEAYLSEITAGARTETERLKAIEEALSSFTYTQVPGELPETVASAEEFLDYFLLESRAGYCSYFATAFVLLARAEGLPARYVQGFCVPVEKKGETVVYSDMAHAWPEVYFEGVGWIPFEPTPGYGKMRYTSWQMRRAREALSRNQDSETPMTRVKEPDPVRQEEEAAETPEDESKGKNTQYVLQIAGQAALWTFLTVLAVFALNRLLSRLRYRKMDMASKLKAEVRRNLRILSFMGMERKEEETLEEFRDRAGAVLGEKELLRFLQSYEDFLYGGRKADQQILAEAKEQQGKLEEVLKRYNRWISVYYHILFL